jgi:NADH-quinone oxidoreductase subunit L
MAPEILLNYSIAILLLPLLGFTILIFWGKMIGPKWSGILGTSILGIDLLLSIYVCYSKLVTFADMQLIQTKFTWFDLGGGGIKVGIGLDNLAAVMLIVVNLISFLVHLFSNEYMLGDKRFSRFFAYLGIFTFSMLGIVLANNFLFMYVFWELVGVSSYLLIGFWYEKDSAANASKKAFITNRIGDLGFFAGIMILFFTYNTFMFDEIFAAIGRGMLPFDSGTFLTAAGILVFCGAIGKSAQFPLHVWLPDAMEGPTPVSALIHAATMVAAGVYLTAKVFPMFSAGALIFIAAIGAITAFISATIAITQNDFKRVLAYSTVSQLGYMIMAIGVGAYTVGFMHLVTHAWFKACLFLASGSVIHAMHHAMHHLHDHHSDPQDIRNMGGLRKTMPKTYYTFLFATLAISGVPLTSGFLSKDGILAGTLAFANLAGGGIYWLIPIAGFGAAGMTAFYMFRLAIVSFHGKPKTVIAEKTHENNWVIVLPLLLLAGLSFWFFYSPSPLDASKGWFSKKLAAPATVVPAEHQWSFLMPYATEPAAGHETSTHAEAKTETHTQTGHGAHHGANLFEEEMHRQHTPAMILSLLIAGGGMLLSFAIYQFKLANPDTLARQMGRLYKLSYNKWYFDEIYDKTAIGGTLLISKILAWFDNTVVDGLVNLTATITRGISYAIAHFDNGIIDGLVNLIANVTGFMGAGVRKLQTGKVQTYIAFAIIALMVIIYWVSK